MNMDNYKMIALWDDSDFNNLFYAIRKAINEVHKQRLSEAGIRINIPDYVIKLISAHHRVSQTNSLEYEEGKTTFFGYPVYPSFENLVVVFHVDMPVNGNTAYQVVDLKQIKG